MDDVKELLRLPSPAPSPQGLAFDGEHLWMSSIQTDRLYAIDPQKWTVAEEAQAPGKPYGMVVLGDELRVVVSEGDEDDRYIVRFVAGHGFKTDGRLDCPELTGSYLGYDGERLYLSQFGNKRVLTLGRQGEVLREIALPRHPCGQVVVDGCFYFVTTERGVDECFLTRVDARGATPVVEDLVRFPFPARGLAYDGTRFWINHRDQHEIVAFER
ncbi:MAG TPA: hypothetical protein VNF68_05305 [Candidatus Baltobacteraceae bacterium]|nr:hypothetical protein [Candidatus Baltobacteraceae bacterium]